MSPEQFQGKVIDGQADQYSFCVCLFEALYGETPFEGRDLNALMENVLAGRRKALPVGAGVPEWLRVILEKGLSQEPADRYPSMRELLDALAQDPEEAARRAREARQRSLGYVGLGALLATGAVLLALFPPLRAELLYYTALTLRFLGKYAEAEPVLEEAIQAASQWRMTTLAARAGIEAATLIGGFLQRPTEGLIYSRHAQALVRGSGSEVERWIAEHK